MWWFLAPSVIPLVIITIGPMLFLYYVSMTNYELGTQLGDAKFIWFDNFIRLFSGKDREFWSSIRSTLSLGIMATICEVLLGVLIALLLDSLERIRGFLSSILMLPMVVTPVIVGLVWKLMMNNEHGVINWMLNNTIGTAPTWLGPQMSLFSVLLVEVWQWTPFVTLIVLSGLASLPVEPLEMAEIDGANAWQKFFLIKLPLLKPILFLAILFRMIDVLKIFDIIFIMTAGGPGSTTEVLSIHAYRLGFVNTGWIGRASATAVVLSLITMAISNVMIKQLQKAYKER
ncbi:MAG: sugar ABC transporter permease [Chloroflexi bacterium]|nr:sugar ABC transporter permease [Chloroflexota bacterium]